MTPLDADGSAGVAVLCTLDGELTGILHDSLGFGRLAPPPTRLHELCDAQSRERVDGFLAEAVARGVALGWEMILNPRMNARAVDLFGLLRGGEIVAMAATGPQDVFAVLEQTLHMVHEQSAELRTLRKELSQPRLPGLELSEFARLNNELVNAQRALSKTNAELARQEARFRRLLSEGSDALLVVDAAGLVRFANAAAARLFESSVEAMTGAPAPLLLLVGGPWEAQVEQSSGRPVTVEITCVGSSWEGDPVLVGNLRDVSLRKRAEQERDDAERVLRHDLRSPLGAISSLAGIVRESGGLSEEHALYLSHIETTARRLQRMASLSVELARLEQGSYEAADLPASLLAVLRDSAQDCEGLSRRQGVRLELPGEDVGLVRGEADLLTTAVSNLLANAVEASPRGAVVRASLGEADGQALLILHNQGAVPEPMRQRFFEKYATWGKRGGTGLGTYSAWRVALAHRGDLAMRSSEAEGTTLILRLPLWTGAP